MEDRLTRTQAHVENRSVALLDVTLTSDLRRSQMAAANQVRMFAPGLLQSCKMFLGDHQDMCGCLRLNVLKGKDVLVFINFFRWNLAAKNAAEKAIAGGVCHGSITMAKTITLQSGDCLREAGQ
jgi:hypothetical protein